MALTGLPTVFCTSICGRLIKNTVYPTVEHGDIAEVRISKETLYVMVQTSCS